MESVCRLEDGKRLVSVLSVNRMFDSPEVRSEIAEHRAKREETRRWPQNTASDDGRGDEELFVVFRLDDEEYAVDVDAVQEIIRVPEALIRVPKSYDFVEGLVNLRGTVLPVVDLRTRLGLDRGERDERQRIVVLIIGGVRTGFIVDSVAEVARVGAPGAGARAGALRRAGPGGLPGGEPARAEADAAARPGRSAARRGAGPGAGGGRRSTTPSPASDKGER